MELKEKGHGFIRKNKAGKVVSGIILGTTMFLAGQVSADEVKPSTEVAPKTTVAPSTTETPKANDADASKQEVKAETKEAPKTEEVKDQAGLDKKYSELKDQAKKLDVEVKEGKEVTHKTVADASKDLDEQGKKVEELAKVRDEANAKLQGAIADAEKAGVKFEGETPITLVQGKEVEFEGEVATAEKVLKEATAKQNEISNATDKVISDAKAKGVDVTVSGETVVDVRDADSAFESLKSTVDKAVADSNTKKLNYKKALTEWEKTVKEGKAKVESDYQTALTDFQKQVDEVNARNEKIKSENEQAENNNKNAKSTLSSDSTAKKNADGSYTQTISGVSKTKTTTNTTTTTGHEPMDLIQIIDLSGSLSDGEYKQRNGVTGARKQQISDMIYVIEHQLTDQDHVMLAFYGTNKGNSYVVGGQDGGIATKLMTKKEAIALLNKINAEKQVHEVAQSWTLIPNVIKPLLENYVASDAQDGTGFEDVYKAQSNRNKVVSVLQFTDNWTLNEKEDIDTTFAEWAKATAKTFMTVVDDPDPDSSLSVSQMKKAGHPNIKTFKSLTASNRQEEIAKLFQSTATVTKTTTTTVKSKGVIAITPEVGLKLVSAELVSPSGKKQVLEVKGNQANFNGDLAEEGEYKVNYTFASTDNKEAVVKGSFVVDGKENSKTDKFISTPTEKTKDLEKVPNNAPKKGEYKAPDRPTAPEAEKVSVSKLVVRAKKPKIEKTIAEVHPVQVEQVKEKPVVKQTANVLPSTGSTASVALVMAGVGMLSLAGASLKKKKD